eukprot:149748-Prymnesium_polylepis.1
MLAHQRVRVLRCVQSAYINPRQSQPNGVKSRSETANGHLAWIRTCFETRAAIRTYNKSGWPRQNKSGWPPGPQNKSGWPPTLAERGAV